MSNQFFMREGKSLSEIQAPFKKSLLEDPLKAKVELRIGAVLSGLCKWKVSSTGIEYEAGS